jgi:hypothetical protein
VHEPSSSGRQGEEEGEEDEACRITIVTGHRPTEPTLRTTGFTDHHVADVTNTIPYRAYIAGASID